jgi:hypothetical protein
MKRAISLVVCGLGLSILAGCPIYSDDRGSRVCIGNTCYSCPNGSYSGDCTGFTCGGGFDCPSGYTCGSDQQCHYGSGACASPNDCPSGSNCGADSTCHAGDCSLSGCPTNYVCKLGGGSAGVPACVPLGGGVSDAGAGGDGGGGITSTCKSDTDCSDGGTGAKCLTGSCVAAADQCADTTQCPNGAQCVAGVCTPSCSAGKACPTGYGCDTNKGVCTQNPAPCADSSTCNGKVCVEQHCVDSCGAGGTCGAGLTCVDGGCTPTQTPVFVCNADGAQDACQPGSICLRHSCYIACGGDAGADTCKAADQFNQCKSVTTSSGAHQVCGSTTNLGSDCDPTQGKNCAGSLICIDGFCK